MLELKNLQTTRNNLLNWVFQDKDGVIKDKPQFVFNMFVDHLEESYRSWYVSDANQRIDLCEFKKSDYENNSRNS